MLEIKENTELLELTAEIVEAHVSNNALAVTDLPDLIGTVYKTLAEIGQGPTLPRLEPAVPVTRSVRPVRKIKCLSAHKDKLIRTNLLLGTEVAGASHVITRQQNS